MSQPSTVTRSQIARVIQAFQAHGIAISGALIQPDGMVKILSAPIEDVIADGASWIELAGEGASATHPTRH